MVWGAGMVLRAEAWREALHRGGVTHDSGRVGATLGGAEDIEICLMIRASGWRIWYEPRLRLRHFLPADRIAWHYLRRLHRGSALAVSFDGYHLAHRHNGPWTFRDRLRWSWGWQTIRAVLALIQRPQTLVRMAFSDAAGDPAILDAEGRLGRLLGMLRSRSVYAATVREIVTRFPQSHRLSRFRAWRPDERVA
jgi:hypothetical protein